MKYPYLYSRLDENPTVQSLANTNTATYLLKNRTELLELYLQFNVKPPQLEAILDLPTQSGEKQLKVQALYELSEEGNFKIIENQEGRVIKIKYKSEDNPFVPDWVLHAFRVLCIMDLCFLEVPQTILSNVEMPLPLTPVINNTGTEITYAPYSVIAQIDDDGEWVCVPNLPVFVDRNGNFRILGNGIVPVYSGIQTGDDQSFGEFKYYMAATYPTLEGDTVYRETKEGLGNRLAKCIELFKIPYDGGIPIPENLIFCGNEKEGELIIMGCMIVINNEPTIYTGYDPYGYWTFLLQFTYDKTRASWVSRFMDWLH